MMSAVKVGIAGVLGLSVFVAGVTVLSPLDNMHRLTMATASEEGVTGFDDGAFAVSAEALSMVRGQLFRRDAYGRGYAAPGIAVRLWHPQYGASSFSNSDREGMYYLYNVPAGDFTLEVWLTGQPEHVLRRPLRVDGRAVVDVPPIQVP